MANATQVDTAIGIDKFKQEPIQPEIRQHRRQTYRRTCQHYVTNNNTSIAPTVNVVANIPAAATPIQYPSADYAVFDQGYVHIPFTSTAMAMDAADWDEIQIGASRLRIVDCGFEITRITCSQQTVTTAAATTTVTNQFTQAPTMMLVKDEDHVLAGMATIDNPVAIGPSACSSVMVKPGIANKSFPHSFTDGALPKVRWLQACGAGTIFDTEISFDLLKGGHVHLLSTSDTYKYHWTDPDSNRWLAPFQMGNVDTLVDETARNLSYYPGALGGSFTAAILQNVATDVNRNLIAVPVNHFIRVPPLYTQLSAVVVTLEVWIEYSMTIEWVPGRYLTTRALTGGDGSALAGNMIPFAEHRRMMLAFSAGNTPPPTLDEDGEMEGHKRRKMDSDLRKKREKERWNGGYSSKDNTTDMTDGAPIKTKFQAFFSKRQKGESDDD